MPTAFFKLQDQTFFDEAGHGWFDLPEGRRYFNGWISLFGELNGGRYFFTNLFRLGDTPSALIWWNLSPIQYRMTYIDVWGLKPDGTIWEHIYAVRISEQTRSGPLLVTVDGMTFIQSIAFYGLTYRYGSADQ